MSLVQPAFSAGDIWYTQADNQYSLYKILAVDTAFDTLHVLGYVPVASLPAVIDMDVMIYHMPMATTAFADATFLTNEPIVANELIGYHTYLRETRDSEEYLPMAIGYFNDAYAFTDEQKYDAAIDAYSKAIDLFPPFYEAIDNRAFCKMDLGLWEAAIEDFKLSLATNPDSFLAEFSIGECYFKMGDYAHAKLQFEKADTLSPGDEHTKMYLTQLANL